MATGISIALEELPDKTGADVDFLREAVRALVKELMETEVTRQLGAARHERTPERKTHRNGYRHRSWVDRLIQALGMTGISKSEVSRLCAELDEMVEAFRNRPLTGRYPYLWPDAKDVKVREGGRVLNMALVVAVDVMDTGEREVLGRDATSARSR